MTSPNLMILAGGISSRMKKSAQLKPGREAKYTQDALSKSKAMIGFGPNNRPFLDYLLYNAMKAGYEDVLIIHSNRDSSIRDYYGTLDEGNLFHGLRISYAIQSIPPGRTKPLGTADAVLQGLQRREDWAGRQFTVCNSDNIYSRIALSLLRGTNHRNAMIDYDRDALGVEASRIASFSVIQKDHEGFLTHIIEKPAEQEIEHAKGPGGRVGVSMNIFRFLYDDIFPFVQKIPLHPVRGEKELPLAVMAMIHTDPRSMYAYELAEPVPDLTSLGDVANVSQFLSREFKEMDW